MHNHRRSTDVDVMSALLTALDGGGVDLAFARIEGYCGYFHRQDRSIRLNPDATPDQLVAELATSLTRLAPPTSSRPALRLIRGGAS